MSLSAFLYYTSPRYRPIYIPIILSLLGTLIYVFPEQWLTTGLSPSQWLRTTLSDRWSFSYFLCAPFIHAGWFHFLFNAMALHFIGGNLLLPVIGKRPFVLLFLTAMVLANIVNNIATTVPAVGISAGIMALLSCSIYPFGRAPMKLLIIHDLLPLPPFPLRYVAFGIASIDVFGLIFGWHFFAHWAHLTGFATGLIAGFFIFRYRRRLP